MDQTQLENKIRQLEIRVSALERVIEWADTYDPSMLTNYTKTQQVLERMEEDRCGK